MDDHGFIFKQLQLMETRLNEINHLLQDPETIGNQSKYRSLMKEHASLGSTVETFGRYKRLLEEIAQSKTMLETETDSELVAMAKEDLSSLDLTKNELEQSLKLMLLPKDPNDDKNIVLEIRAGAGGDEASLFAEELFTAYSHYANDRGWKTEILSISQGNVGGFKEIIAIVTGDSVFSRLKYESGVHRVQRVPKTETQGRIHTSTVTVACLPEAEEVEVEIHPNDLRIDVFRSGGSGGQSVNTTDSAVRVVHIPSGIVVSCQDEKSQLKNKNKALKILYARLLARQQEEAQKQASDARLAQIGTGDRSERIRTYNFPQTRITDHRIGLTIHQLAEVMGGKLDLVIAPLITYYQTEALKEQK